MAPRTAELRLVDEDEADEELELVKDVDPDDAKKAKPLVYDEETPNLVPLFMDHPEGDKALGKIARQVFDDFERDWESTEEYRQKNVKRWKLFTGDLPKKSFPFEGAANAHVPMMFENLTRVIFRAYDELFSDWSGVFGVMPLGPDDALTAEILTKHGNWQISDQIGDFKRQMFRAMMLYFVGGDVVNHSYFDPFAKQNRHETLDSDTFVVPYVHVTTQPDYSDVPRRSKVRYMQRHELQAMRDIWDDIDDVLDKKAAPWDDDPESLWDQERAKVTGIEIPTDDDRAPYKLIQYEGWTEHLPDQGNDRFIQAILDYRTKRLLSLVIYEEASWQEKLRFERQTGELEAFRAAAAEHAQVVADTTARRESIVQNAQAAMDAGAFVDPAMVEQELAQHDPNAAPPPPPPDWLENPDDPEAAPAPARLQPIHTFVHGVCIEPIVGNLGLGFGSMEADLNRAANVLWSQYIDSATLGNVWSLITAGNLEFERPFQFRPGMINVAKGVSGAQLKDAIHELKPPPANPQMIEAVRELRDWGQAAASAADVLSGESGKSGETAKGIMARIEQATKMISVPTRLFGFNYLTPVLKLNARLNSMFLDDEEIVLINNHLIGMAEELKIGAKLYQRDYRTQIMSDMRFASRAQRVAEADEVAAMTQDPMLAANVPFKQMAIAKSLKARGQHDMVAFLGPMLPPPETPMGIQPPQPAMIDPATGQPVQPPPGPPGAPPAAPPQEAAPQQP